jgi:hypothetical protein
MEEQAPATIVRYQESEMAVHKKTRHAATMARLLVIVVHPDPQLLQSIL